LIALSFLTGFGYFAAAVSSNLIWLIPTAFAGILNGMGRDRGPAGTLEQAILPETTDAEDRSGYLPGTTSCSTAATRSAVLAALAFAGEHRLIFFVCGAAALACVARIRRCPDALRCPNHPSNPQREPLRFALQVIGMTKANKERDRKTCAPLRLDSIGGGSSARR
jgi:hypothetical protein